MSRPRSRLALVLVLPLCASTLACSSRGAPPAVQTLFVGRPADAIGLDPARVSDTESAEVCEQIYDHLVRYRIGTNEIEPSLAESWSVSSSGTEWTFRLRKNVRFHDGTPFDADAVVFNIERQRDPHHPAHQVDFAYRDAFESIRRVDKLDDHQVRIVIDRPYAPFLANMAMFAAGIISPAAVKKWGAEYPYHPVGTGAFRFVDWSRGERLTLAASVDYWGGVPRVERLVFMAVPEQRQRLAALEAGAIHVAMRLSPADLQFVALHPELKTERVAGNNVSYLAMNTEHPPFDDLRVRIAVSHAVHKVPIVKMVYQGFAIPATGPLAPSTWGHADQPEREYSSDLARSQLEATGYRWEQRPKLYVMSTPRPYLPAPEQVARTIARNLHDIGMEVEIVVNDIDTHLRKTSNGEHDLCLLGWTGDNGDPDNFLYGLFDSDNARHGSARNLAFFKDPSLDRILARAQEARTRDARVELYADAQRIIWEKAPWVPIAHAEIVVAHRQTVQGLVVPATSVLSFRNVFLESR